ncbi:MAG: hypothetical protein UT21_C0011G0008 [Candidatus Woesebacteria bacterium GW2011_GWA1_39_11b]|nr:MAG: hypothetical protein UT21_C0011G0008 [Candidatus Woesebacteria bacterium GW2011_GWA1_39_11b]
MSNKICAKDGCEVLLTGRQKTCCSMECKKTWFGESRKKENPKWTEEYKKEYSKKYRENNKEKISNLGKTWRGNNKDSTRKAGRKEREKLKFDILNHYSNGKLCCANCSFNDSRALQVDHIENNGAEERRKLFGNRLFAGTTFYRWVRRNNYPEGYAILCANCNIIKLREFEKTQWK